MTGQERIQHEQAMQVLGGFERFILDQTLSFPYRNVAVLIATMKGYIEQQAAAEAALKGSVPPSLEILPTEGEAPQQEAKVPLSDGEHQGRKKK